jgi:uncharacterized Zn finger protein
VRVAYDEVAEWYKESTEEGEFEMRVIDEIKKNLINL